MNGVGGPTFPFSAIVGHDDLRTALLANAVDPTIGGLLVRGEKGTAKSTAVRSLVRLLPRVEVVDGCPFACAPREPEPGCPAGPHDGAEARSRPARLVELPVGASTDRVSGSLDVTRALREGERAFDPGLLAAAHRGVLYVDEVNLLADHLVDLLLDAAALGVNYVERDGVSVRHAARFLLVGTMNPEEGELRPQLLDRFGLSVEVRGSRDPAERAEVVRRRLAFEADPAAFLREYESQDAALCERIGRARESLPRVALPDRMVALIAGACARLDVDGLRADIVCARAARALAALEGSPEVNEEHVRRAARLAVPHRRRRGPLEQPGLDDDELERALAGEPPDDEPPPGGPDGGHPRPGRAARENARPSRDPQAGAPADVPGQRAGAPGTRADAPQRAGAQGGKRQGGDEERPFESGAPAPERRDEPLSGFKAVPLGTARTGHGRTGRRARGRADTGRPVGERPHEPGGGIALLATLVAAAPHQRARGRRGVGLALESHDLRSPVLEGRSGVLLVLVLDASGSMAARRRMAQVKGALLALLVDAYQRRDLVALIAARDADAEVVLPPTASVAVAARRLAELRAGGRTPLHAGLDRARQLVRAQRVRGDRRRPVVLLVTDGRANAGAPDPAGAARRAAAALRREGATLVVIDSEQGAVRLGMAAALAEAAGGAPLVSLDALAPGARRAA